MHINKKKKFQYLIEEWGADFQSEHERYLVEKKFKKPVIISDYPKDIKAFYMRMNDDGKTVRAMDVLFPGIGEIIVAKHRNGAQGKVRLRFIDQYARFDNLNEIPDYEQMHGEDLKSKALNPENSTYTVKSKMNQTDESKDLGDFDTRDMDQNDF